MSVQFSLLPNEYITPGTILTLKTSHQLHHDQSQHLVKILPPTKDGQEENRTRVHGNELQISTADLTPGRYVVAVNHLCNSEGDRIDFNPIYQAFNVRELRGSVPDDFRILHVVHLAVGQLGTTRLSPGEEAPEGTQRLDRIKGVNKQTQILQEITFDSDGNEVDAEELLRDLAVRRFSKYGNIQESLWNRLEAADDNDLFKVMIWPELEHDYCDYDKHNLEASSDHASSTPRHISAFQNPKSRIKSAVEQFGANVSHKDHLPAVVTELTPTQIREISKHEDVGMVFSHDLQAIVLDAPQNLYTSLSISRVTRAHKLGFTGKGINVGLFEAGWADLTDMDYTDMRIHDAPAAPTTNPDGTPVTIDVKNHYRWTSSIIKNKAKNQTHGYAPDCNLYFVNFRRDVPADEDDALAWGINTAHCSVISQSFHPTAFTDATLQHQLPDDGQLSAADTLKDWYQTTPPFPLIVQAAGNNESTMTGTRYVVHKGYNGLIVGNHDQSGTSIFTGSLFINPVSDHHDRELPDISAMGCNLTILGETGIYGTSFAAPAVAGTVALMQQAAPTLVPNPEASRAIIYATAGRRVGHPMTTAGAGETARDATWWDDVSAVPKRDLKDGAGMLDSEAAVKVACNFSWWFDASARAGGWSHGWLSDEKFGPDLRSLFHHDVVVPVRKAGDVVTFRAALAWNSRARLRTVQDGAGAPYVSTLPYKYDLGIVDADTNAFVAWSASFDNNYEIAEFKATPGKKYSIYVLMTLGTSNPDLAWYGIAWEMFFDKADVWRQSL